MLLKNSIRKIYCEVVKETLRINFNTISPQKISYLHIVLSCLRGIHGIDGGQKKLPL